MKNNGFTLIELLAVIVILAIIALIATPIVLSIIDNTKQSSMLRSAEMYLKGVETSVATATLNEQNIPDNTYPITKHGDVCLVDLTNTNECPTKENTLEIQMNGEKPQSGSVAIASGKITDITFTYANGKTIVKNAGKLAFAEDVEDTPGTNEKTLASLCTKTSGEEKTAGALYSCEVKPGTSYNFYVLKTPAEGDTTINLIMDQNINSDGTPAGMTGTTKSGENVYNLVAWISDSTHGCGSDGDYCATNEKGPITAMQFLYNATKDWTNIAPVNYTYNDKDVQGTTNANTSYTSFVSENGIATIKALDPTTKVTIGTSEYPLRARMPIYSSDASITEATSKTNASYLYDNLDPAGNAAPYGYWTLSSYAGDSNLAWFVNYLGIVSSGGVDDVYDIGVRPVITLKI